MLQLIDVGYEVKELQEDGSFSGYASVFGTEDAYGDTVQAGAFKKSLAAWRKKKRAPAMLWAHKTDEPIGVWTSMEEDETGLATEGKLALKTQRGAEAYELLKLKAISGLSIGFNPIKSKLDDVTGKRTLVEIELWETSLVVFPANDEARIGSVRAALREGRKVRHSDIEEILRREGFSYAQARAIAVSGLAASGLLHEDQEAVAKAVEVLTNKIIFLKGNGNG